MPDACANNNINPAQNNVRPSSCSLDAAECRCDELRGGTFYCYIGYHILIMVSSGRPVVSSFGRVLAWRGHIFIARSLYPCCCCTFEFELVDRRHILIIWSIDLSAGRGQRGQPRLPSPRPVYWFNAFCLASTEMASCLRSIDALYDVTVT